jgi:hypothetical protein
MAPRARPLLCHGQDNFAFPSVVTAEPYIRVRVPITSNFLLYNKFQLGTPICRLFGTAPLTSGIHVFKRISKAFSIPAGSEAAPTSLTKVDPRVT